MALDEHAPHEGIWFVEGIKNKPGGLKVAHLGVAFNEFGGRKWISMKEAS